MLMTKLETTNTNAADRLFVQFRFEIAAAAQPPHSSGVAARTFVAFVDSMETIELGLGNGEQLERCEGLLCGLAPHV